MKTAAWISAIALLAAPCASASGTRATDLGKRLFERLAGRPLLETDPRYAAYRAQVDAGNLRAAAGLATGDDGFYSITLRNWAAIMENRDGTPLIDFDDFQAAVIGSTRDELDARTLLTGDYSYIAAPGIDLEAPSRAHNEHYLQIDNRGLNLRTTLVRVAPQWAGESMETAGLLTTRGWAARQYLAGTNRRALALSFQAFLCSPIQSWKSTALSDYHVRRDVTRAPGGVASTYQSTCRGCHAPMDAMAGAFARFDFDAELGFLYYGPFGIAPKYNQNAKNFPTGWVTIDDSWVNLIRNNPEFGWRSRSEGRGIREFGAMLANSEQFSRCMTRRAYRTVCRKEPTTSDAALIQTLASRFELDGYKLKNLFKEVAIAPDCLEDHGPLDHISFLRELELGDLESWRQEPSCRGGAKEF